jgi:DEAD/DEAH box helicase domain-containing protein
MAEMERAAVLSAFCTMIKSLAPVSLMCDRSDLGAAWRVRDDHYGMPAIYVWDRYPGGTGLAEALSRSFAVTLAAVSERIDTCPCESGCPSCIGVPEEAFAAVSTRKAKAALFARLVLQALALGPKD